MARKPLIDQLNDIIAPVTQAWTDPEILEVTIRPQGSETDYITVEVKLKLLAQLVMKGTTDVI